GPGGRSWLHPRIARRPVNHAAVDRLTGSRSGLKEQIVAGDLHERERLILVEVRRRHRRWTNVAPAQLAARAVDEVRDASLRLDALIDVVVARVHDVDAVSHEQRLEQHAEIDGRSVAAAV